jgi:hypothetical protein
MEVHLCLQRNLKANLFRLLNITITSLQQALEKEEQVKDTQRSDQLHPECG